MKCAISLCLCYFYLPALNGFNLDVDSAFIWGPDDVRDLDVLNANPTYFGYSVLLQKENSQAKLLVGAPLANATIMVDFAVTYNTGNVYRCPIDGKRSMCVEEDSVFNTFGESPMTGVHSTYKDRIYKSHSNGWFGVNMADNGPWVCGHRFKYAIYEKAQRKNLTDYDMLGVCQIPSSTKAEPLYNNGRRYVGKTVIIDGKDFNIFDHQFGQAGSSIHVPDAEPDDENIEKEVLMGAPGVHSWTGTVTRTLLFPKDTRKKMLYQVPDPSDFRDMYGKKAEFLEFYDYFGYSVSSGRFFSQYPGKQYVGGAPRGASNHGKVLIFMYEDNETSGINAAVRVIKSIDGRQLGEYFGSSVLAVDVNNDNNADLLIGAPMHDASNGASEGEHGRVYVFLSTGQTLEEKESLLGEKMAGARFGSAMSYADVNNDGYTDVLIGAPLRGYQPATKNGWGAVYLYHGSAKGLASEPSQIIYPQDLGPAVLQGLGVSISKPLDVDDNGYADTAVGAYNSGHAVVLRSRSIVHLDVDVKTNYSNGIPTTSGGRFQIKVFLEYSGSHVPEDLNLELTLTLDDAAVFDETGEDTYKVGVVLRKAQKEEAVTVIGRISSLSDVINPIQITVKSELGTTSSRSSQDFPPPKPILDESRSVVRYLDWKWDCDNGDYCITDLSTQLEVEEFPGDSGVIEVGSKTFLNLTITLKNSDGDKAYGTELVVLLPGTDSGVELNLANQCNPDKVQESPHNQTKHTCFLRPVVEKSEVMTFKIVLNIQKLMVAYEQLRFSAEVTTKVNDTNKKNDKSVFTMKLQARVDAAISGYSKPEQIPFKRDHKREEKLVGTPYLFTFYHQFQVYKDGPTTMEHALVDLHIPRKWNGIKFLKVLQTRITGGTDDDTCMYISGSQEDPWAYSPQGIDNGQQGKRRRKREVVANQKKEALTQEQSVASTEKKNSLLLYCNGGSDCVQMKCDIRNVVSKEDKIWVNLTLQIDLTALKEEVRYISEVRLESKGNINLQKPKRAKHVHGSTARTEAFIVTSFIPEGPPETRPVPWWVYLLAVLGGILFIVIIILLCWKCGFFKRQKRDEMRSMMHEPVLETADDAAGAQPAHAAVEPIRLSNAHFVDDAGPFPSEDASLIGRTVFVDEGPTTANGSAPTDLTVPDEILNASTNEGSSLIDPSTNGGDSTQPTSNNVNSRHSTAL